MPAQPAWPAVLRQAWLPLVAGLLVACGSAPADTRAAGALQPLPPPPSLPDETGWGVHVLSMAGTPHRVTWVGTYDGELHRLAHRAREWEPVAPAAAAQGPVTSLAFDQRDSLVVWYGTAGGGFARSGDGGESWRAWPQSQAASWNWVVPRGIVVRRDTVYVATTDGLRFTGDAGASWTCIRGQGAPAPAAGAPEDGCTTRLATLPTSHLLSVEVTPRGVINVGHLRGLSRSADGGRSWTDEATPGLAGQRVRSVRLGPDSLIWALTETALYADSPRVDGFREIPLRVPGFPELPGGPRMIIAQPGQLPVLIATSYGMLAETPAGDFRLHFLSAADRFRPAGDIWTGGWWGPPMIPLGGSSAGINRILAGESPIPAFLDAPPPAAPVAGRHLRFGRPVRAEDGSPYADGTALFGSAPVGHGDASVASGIRFQNPAGTQVRAVAAGTVVTAQANDRVLIRHDGAVEGRVVYTLYTGLGAVQASAGQRVDAGAVLGVVGNQARPAGVRLSVLALAPGDTAAVATTMSAPASSPAAGAINPQLWLEPLPGTGVVAGRVLDANGQPVPGATIHGLVLPYPTEAPFSVLRSYDAGVASSPAYGENFALGDVRAGSYTLGVDINGTRVWRRVRVVDGQVAWVEFRP